MSIINIICCKEKNGIIRPALVLVVNVGGVLVFRVEINRNGNRRVRSIDSHAIWLLYLVKVEITVWVKIMDLDWVDVTGDELTCICISTRDSEAASEDAVLTSLATLVVRKAWSSVPLLVCPRPLQWCRHWRKVGSFCCMRWIRVFWVFLSCPRIDLATWQSLKIQTAVSSRETIFKFP